MNGSRGSIGVTLALGASLVACGAATGIDVGALGGAHDASAMRDAGVGGTGTESGAGSGAGSGSGGGPSSDAGRLPPSGPRSCQAVAECCPTLPSEDIPACQDLAASDDAQGCTEALAEYAAGGACLPGCKTLAGCCMRAALGTTDEANCVNIATSGDEPACKVAFPMYCVE